MAMVCDGGFMNISFISHGALYYLSYIVQTSIMALARMSHSLGSGWLTRRGGGRARVGEIIKKVA